MAYEACDLTKRAGNLSGKQFLLIHGTADRKAHYQQSMLLVRALADQGVLFRHQVSTIDFRYLSYLLSGNEMIVLEFCPADYVQVTQAYDNKKKKPLAFLEFRTLIQVLII